MYSKSIPLLLNKHRTFINASLTFVAVSIEIYYSYCGGACEALSGKFFGIPLQYAGMVFMATIAFLSFAHCDRLKALLVAAGVGAEIYLVGYQVYYNTYCPYCLAFAAIVLLLFAINYKTSNIRFRHIIAMMVFTVVAFAALFDATPVLQYS